MWNSVNLIQNVFTLETVIFFPDWIRHETETLNSVLPHLYFSVCSFLCVLLHLFSTSSFVLFSGEPDFCSLSKHLGENWRVFVFACWWKSTQLSSWIPLYPEWPRTNLQMQMYTLWKSGWLYSFLENFYFSGVVGNLLVVFALVGDKKARNATSAFLVSLAVADLVFLLVCIPYDTAAKMMGFWKGGKPLCKVSGFVEMLSATASILNLTAVSVERWVSLSLSLFGSFFLSLSFSFCLFSKTNTHSDTVFLHKKWVLSFFTKTCLPHLKKRICDLYENLKQLSKWFLVENFALCL